MPKAKKSTLSAPVYSLTGQSTGTLVLPKEVFGQIPNQKLLAQAMRVYFANQSARAGHTKTKGEVKGGGRKPWRQKGTGRARAGSTRSPLWVGGGITFGPRPRLTKLELPQKMKKKALTHALSEKLQQGNIAIINNFEKITPKTKIMAGLLAKINTQGDTLLVSAPSTNLKLAARNLSYTSWASPQNLNAYEILKNHKILFSQEAIAKITSGGSK